MLNIRCIKQLRYNEVCCLFCHFNTINNKDLPQCNFTCYSQVNSCSYYTQCLEHSSHSWNGYAITSFQSRYLRSFHSYTLAKLLLRQVLFYASFLDSFAQSVSMQCFVHITFESVTFWSANFTEMLVKHIVQRSKIHLCHNYLFLKYSFLIASAFAISLLGVFWVFLMMP